MDSFTDPPELIVECRTCPATGTTACGDCVVTHLLANYDGPIEYQPINAARRAVDLFASAGLLDDPPRFVSPAAFASAAPTPDEVLGDLAGVHGPVTTAPSGART